MKDLQVENNVPKQFNLPGYVTIGSYEQFLYVQHSSVVIAIRCFRTSSEAGLGYKHIQ